MTDRRHQDREHCRELVAALTPIMERAAALKEPGDDDAHYTKKSVYWHTWAGTYDTICDLEGEIGRLTDDIGDERGDDYAVERSMHQFRSI